jgi:UDP-N-acetylglucosamine--N-acetylmuramyl-(pentapeptide) pyrophosphoryl-undecaprenol N-acetylglucosamine transferase
MVISGGGTGGHLFPAIAIAQQITTLSPGSEVLFVGALGKIEMDKVPQYGFNIIGLPISGFNRQHMWKNVMLPIKLFRSLLRAWTILGSFKPQVAVGVGGYASGPLLYLAGLRGLPTLIQEQNSYPGATNKILARKAKTICVAFQGMEKHFPAQKTVLTGNPIRKGLKTIPKSEAAAIFGLDPNKKTLLVIGGSLGARTLNESMVRGLDRLKQSGIQLIWQCGPTYFQKLHADIGHELSKDMALMPFIAQMDAAYSLATLVVSRAGALSLAEITFLGKASILVPSPNVAEDHQTKNADSLAASGAALVVPDREAASHLVDLALETLGNDEKIADMEAKSASMALPNAGAAIAAEILKIAIH